MSQTLQSTVGLSLHAGVVATVLVIVCKDDVTGDVTTYGPTDEMGVLWFCVEAPGLQNPQKLGHPAAVAIC